MSKRRKRKPQAPKPPAHLDEAARQKWATVLPILQARGEVDQGAADALAAYCTAWSRWQAAEQEVERIGPVVKSPSGFAIQNPHVALAKAAQVALRQWGVELKLTPRSRPKAWEQSADDQPNYGADNYRVLDPDVDVA